MRAADTALEHATAPDGNAAALADVVNRLRDGKATDAARLDVDDLAGAELDHVLGAVDVGDRLVETESRLHPALELGVPNEVVAAERLLDHDEVEGVELRQVIGIPQAVGGVRVRHEMDVAAERGPHGAHVLHILARLNLELDLSIPLRERGLGALHQRLRTLLYP